MEFNNVRILTEFEARIQTYNDVLTHVINANGPIRSIHWSLLTMYLAIFYLAPELLGNSI